ncbi:MAG TPA: BON domain-containing protein [Thermoleophilaceae bacterium]
MSARSLVIGAAAGAAAVWFLDPNEGARRRNLVRDKALKYARETGSQAQSGASYAAGQAKHAVYEAAPSGGGGEELNDPTLARKVESEIFRSAEAPKGQVSVNVENGVVYLRGQVPDEELGRRLAEDASKVDGVRGVENLLHA